MSRSDYKETERNRHATLERILRIVRYIETSPRWVSMEDLTGLGLQVHRKTLWRYMNVIETVYGLEVRGGGKGSVLQWRAPR